METSTLFFILAGLLIAILLGYSAWSARREKSQVFSNTFSTRQPASPISPPQGDLPASLKGAALQNVEANPALDPQAQARAQIQQEVKEIKISLPNDEPAPAQPEYGSFAQSLQPEQAVDFPPESTAYAAHSAQEMPEENAEPMSPEAETPPQMITLYVVAAEGQCFTGSRIFYELDALGLQFGEYQIFHRHMDNSTSPVLFSVANMMQPGVFDLNHIEHFSTVGLVFFMQLPTTGNNVSNLRMMINTAEALAKNMSGFVLNDAQELFDENARERYFRYVCAN